MMTKNKDQNTPQMLSTDYDDMNKDSPSFKVISTRTVPVFGGHPVMAIVEDNSTGKQYNWNMRQHRKMRLPRQELIRFRFHFLSFQPMIVTWWKIWNNFIANSLWVTNGVFAVWPDLGGESANMIIYATGVMGAFMFIVGAYLGIVEVINQNSRQIVLPKEAPSEEQGHKKSSLAESNYDTALNHLRKLSRPPMEYGYQKHPLQHAEEGYSDEVAKKIQLKSRQKGFPVIVDMTTGRPVIHSNLSEAIVGDQIDIIIDNRLIQASVTAFRELEGEASVPRTETKDSKYIWWTWTPDWDYISVFSAYFFLFATILFFFPACAWYPFANADVSFGVSLFFIYMMQMIPSVGFIIVGHIAMAEASGNWCLHFSGFQANIGYWAGFFNVVGGWGFLLYPILALPSAAEPGCCANLTKWGASLATFWGSCAFWIAGVLECIEFASKNPI